MWSHSAVTAMFSALPSSLLRSLPSSCVAWGQDDHLTQFFLLSLSSAVPPVLLCSLTSLTGFSASSITAGLESGGVILKEPVSDREMENSSLVTLRCDIDGHPRWVSSHFKIKIQVYETVFRTISLPLSLPHPAASQADMPVVQGRCEADGENSSDQQ